MLTQEQIEAAEKIGKKEESVKLLLDFYLEAQADGEKLVKIALNKKWKEIATAMNDTTIKINGDEKTYENLLKTTKLFKEIADVKSKKNINIKKTGSFTDNHADESRK